MFFRLVLLSILIQLKIDIMATDDSKKTKIWSGIISAIVAALTTLATALFG